MKVYNIKQNPVKPVIALGKMEILFSKLCDEYAENFSKINIFLILCNSRLGNFFLFKTFLLLDPILN